ncbi:hypothetical protein GCM10007170_07410 [Arthrobacter liuii]|uniref:Uncharacterized protein n=1 Tax=Arthrobacter liuii TaxID=1476996 RepID=A0ABQ2AGV4_9MICC|nr:hypothetical protein GCM10007170_07410 [Arthrobacter liuii]
MSLGFGFGSDEPGKGRCGHGGFVAEKFHVIPPVAMGHVEAGNANLAFPCPARKRLRALIYRQVRGSAASGLQADPLPEAFIPVSKDFVV